MVTPELPGVTRPRRTAVWIWFGALVAAIVIAARSHYVADLSAFLPSSPTAEQAVLLDQVRSGVAARVLLLGIEGGDASQRSAASRRLADALRASGVFASVNNGDNAAWQDTGRFLFERRYLLSPAVDAERFTVAGLRAAIDDTVALLGTPAGSLVRPIILRDPTGETVRMAEAMLPTQAPRSEEGVWVSRDAPRAVLMATTRADGGDLDAQERALGLVRTTFEGQAPPGLRLLVSGAPLFAVESRAQIRNDVERLAIAGAIVVLLLLLVAFGSLRSVATATVPVATGVLAGIAATSLVFGNVHGVTLGFGATLVGEAVDYAIYYLIQARGVRCGDQDHRGSWGKAGELQRQGNAHGSQRPGDVHGSQRPGDVHGSQHQGDVHGPQRPGDGESVYADRGGRGHTTEGSAEAWLRESWPVVRLGLLTSICGFGALLFSGFPGLAQLGVFSIAGLGAAALATRHVLPVIAPHGAPGGGLRRPLCRFAAWLTRHLPRLRASLLLVSAVAALALALLPSAWRGDLAGLSPVSSAQLALDQRLRADLGASDAGTLVALEAAGESGALEIAEAAGRRLDALVAEGVLQGYESPARVLPSPATQAARRAALPDAAVLAARLAEATADGPLAASRLGGFVADVQAARAQPTVDRSALRDTPLAEAIDSLLVRGEGGRPWRVFLSLRAGAAALDAGRLHAALADVPGARVVHIRQELDNLYARYLRNALWQAGLGALAVAVLLGWHLRSWRRLLQVCLPIAASLVIVLTALTVGDQALGILHLVGLLLVVAIGSNYALFFDHLRLAGRIDDDTLASLALANLTTVATFLLLAFSSIPVLAAMGLVVAPGALLCLLLSAAFLPARPGPEPV